MTIGQKDLTLPVASPIPVMSIQECHTGSMIMSTAHFCSAALLCSTLMFLTGCVGPMACGPAGNCGPVAFGSSCDGCGECEGCGELYIDPWINHPADCCDPCDRCGNFNGQSCGKCRSVFSGVASLWGYRCDSGCGDCGEATCDGGCGAFLSLGGGCDAGCDGCDSCCSPGDLVHVAIEPTPAKKIVEAAPAEKPYTPHRTRKIFRKRPDVAEGPPKSSDY